MYPVCVWAFANLCIRAPLCAHLHCEGYSPQLFIVACAFPSVYLSPAFLFLLCHNIDHFFCAKRPVHQLSCEIWDTLCPTTYFLPVPIFLIGYCVFLVLTLPVQLRFLIFAALAFRLLVTEYRPFFCLPLLYFCPSDLLLPNSVCFTTLIFWHRFCDLGLELELIKGLRFFFFFQQLLVTGSSTESLVLSWNWIVQNVTTVLSPLGSSIFGWAYKSTLVKSLWSSLKWPCCPLWLTPFFHLGEKHQIIICGRTKAYTM